MRIIDAGQFVTLDGPEKGRVRSRITVLLDDGRQESVDTSEETINRLVELMTGAVPPATVTQTATDGRYAVPAQPEESAEFFGGAEASPAIGALTEEAPPPVEEPAPTGLGHGVVLDSKGYPVRGRTRHVDKDEYGYPIVPKEHQQQAPVQAQIDEEEDPGEQI